MKWEEFAILLSGLGENSPLARIVTIRLENDPERLKDFTSAQHRIRNKWRSKTAKSVYLAERDAAVEHFKKMFMKMAQ
jgi:hypothetical protein